jgi:hypothetical protein
MYESIGEIYNSITTGTVLDTNDPQGRNRIKVWCQFFGDRLNVKVEDLPWCIHITPFGGIINSNVMTRGTDTTADYVTEGTVGYGMWCSPKIGSEVAVICLNGDPSRRAYFGSIVPAHTGHTMPHGKFSKVNNDGPFSSADKPIQPLYRNMHKAFNNNTVSPEWATRMSDFACSGEAKNVTNQGDTKDKSNYKQSRLQPNIINKFTGKNYEPHNFSITSPGFHTISFDDSVDNCRLKIRTTGGHHIVLDDTNERIYINTAEGENWIEFDQDGTIDIYTSQKLSIHAKSDINLKSDESIRLTAKNLHLNAAEELRITGKDVHIKATNTLNITPTAIGAGSNAETAFYVNRIPEHEPWPRCDTISDTDMSPKYASDDVNIGKELKIRNPNWQR